MDGGVPGTLTGNHGALQRAGELARKRDAHHLVARLLRLLKFRQKLLRGGLAGGGQAFRPCQHLVKAFGLKVQPVAEHLAVNIYLQGHHTHAKRLYIFAGDVCGGIGDNAYHKFPP